MKLKRVWKAVVTLVAPVCRKMTTVMMATTSIIKEED
jgi:hypothetical protein